MSPFLKKNPEFRIPNSPSKHSKIFSMIGGLHTVPLMTPKSTTFYNYPEIKTESFLTFLTSLTSLTSLHHFSHFCLLSEVLCFIFLLDKSLTGPEMNTESFLSLRTFKEFSVFLSLVKVFHFCLYLGFYCTFHAQVRWLFTNMHKCFGNTFQLLLETAFLHFLPKDGAN